VHQLLGRLALLLRPELLLELRARLLEARRLLSLTALSLTALAALLLLLGGHLVVELTQLLLGGLGVAALLSDEALDLDLSLNLGHDLVLAHVLLLLQPVQELLPRARTT